MKRFQPFFFFLFTITAITVHGKNFKGYVIFPNQEKVEVVVAVPFMQLSKKPDYLEMQSKITYIRDDSHVSVNPDQVLEVAFTYDEILIRMISVRDELKLTSPFANLTNVFLKLEVDGPVRLFRYYKTSQSPGMYNSENGMSTSRNSRVADRFVLQRDLGALTRLESRSFKKDVAGFFPDCPALIKKVEDKEYKKEDMELMVRYYNRTCAKKSEN